MRNGGGSKRVTPRRTATGWFGCLGLCGWRRPTRTFWIAAIDELMTLQCPRCGGQVAFCQSIQQYRRNTGRG